MKVRPVFKCLICQELCVQDHVIELGESEKEIKHRIRDGHLYFNQQCGFYHECEDEKDGLHRKFYGALFFMGFIKIDDFETLNNSPVPDFGDLIKMWD